MSQLVSAVYGATGRPDDNGYLNTPTGSTADQNYKDNYSIRERNIINWGAPRQIRLGFRIGF